MAEAGFVDRFKEPRAKLPMNFECSFDDTARELINGSRYGFDFQNVVSMCRSG